MDEDQKLRWQVIGLLTGVSSPLAEYVRRTTKMLRDRRNAEQSSRSFGTGRETIKHDFLDWRNPIEIAIQHKLAFNFQLSASDPFPESRPLNSQLSETPRE